MTEATHEIYAEDPPSPQRGRSNPPLDGYTRDFVEKAMSDPGTFYRFAPLGPLFDAENNAYTIRNRIAAGRVSPWNKGHWVAVTRKIEGKWAVWAKYDPKPEPVEVDDAQGTLQ